MKIFYVAILCFIMSVACRDFYVGMFKRNDILVAQDRLYKERVPFTTQFAKYGRYFKCPITYFRVVDRLGARQGPKVEIIRGGLGKRYMVLRFRAYNLPISVNVYVGCENKMKMKFTNSSQAIQIAAAAKPEGDAKKPEGDAKKPEGDAKKPKGD